MARVPIIFNNTLNQYVEVETESTCIIGVQDIITLDDEYTFYNVYPNPNIERTTNVTQVNPWRDLFESFISNMSEEKKTSMRAWWNTCRWKRGVGRAASASGESLKFDARTYTGNVITPVGATYGTPMSENLLNFAGVRNVGFLEVPILPYSYFFWIGNAIQQDIDDGVATDPVLQEIAHDFYVGLPDDNTTRFDVYINTKRNATIGGNEMTEILVRWNNNAVNLATDEYLAQNPDYPYKPNTARIEFYVANYADDFNVFDLKKIDSCLYGTLEKLISGKTLTQYTTIFESSISALFPSTKIGDIALGLRLVYDGQPSEMYRAQLAFGQIPLNSTTLDVSHLHTKRAFNGSYVVLHYGKPEQGVDDDTLGWNEAARDNVNNRANDTVSNNESSSDISADYGRNSNIGLLTDTYALTEDELRQLGRVLWDADFYENIQMLNNSPIENIISVKAFPYALSGGERMEIKLGNVLTGVNASKIPTSFTPIKTIGTFRVSRRYSGSLDWLNYTPATNVSLFLPYVGIVSLNAYLNDILDKTCTLKYIYDVILGDCTACLYVGDIEIAKWSGNLAIDIPITASNRAQVQLAHLTGSISAVSQFIGGIASGFMTSGITGAILGSGSGIATGIQTAMTPYHSQTNGTPSSACDSFDMQNAYLIIDRPIYDMPSTYAHERGLPCNLSCNLSSLKGFTQCDAIHADDIPCTEEERLLIEQALKEGVIL